MSVCSVHNAPLGTDSGILRVKITSYTSIISVCLISGTHFKKSISSFPELGVNASFEKTDDKNLDFDVMFEKNPVFCKSCLAAVDILL